MKKEILNVSLVRVLKITKKSALVWVNGDTKKYYVSQKGFNSLMSLLLDMKEVPCIVADDFFKSENPAVETTSWLIVPQLF